MNESLNEEFLIKRIAKKPLNTKVVSEDLGSFYSTKSESPYSLDASGLPQSGVSLKLTTTLDGHTIEIKQGDSKFSVANDKFVLLTKNYLTAIMRDMEQLKKMYIAHERKLSQLTAKVDSYESLKNRLNSLQNRTPPEAFKHE